MSPYRIVLADDHDSVRQCLKMIIRPRQDLEVVGEAEDGVRLLRLLDDLDPSLVILDITMPGLNGIEATRQIKRQYPDMKVLVLTMHPEEEYLSQALLAGADGYLLKEDSWADLFLAIERIRQGKIYVTPSLLENLDLWEKVLP